MSGNSDFKDIFSSRAQVQPFILSVSALGRLRRFATRWSVTMGYSWLGRGPVLPAEAVLPTVQDVQQLSWLLSDITPPRRSESAPPCLADIFQCKSISSAADDTQKGVLGRSNLQQLRSRFAISALDLCVESVRMHLGNHTSSSAAHWLLQLLQSSPRNLDFLAAQELSAAAATHCCLLQRTLGRSHLGPNPKAQIPR